MLAKGSSFAWRICKHDLTKCFSWVQLKSPLRRKHEATVRARVAEPAARYPKTAHESGSPDPNVLYDAIIIGGGMGGLTTASQMAAKGAKVLVLEK